MTASSLAAAPAFPTKRDEAWRYAPHDQLRQLSFGPPGDAPLEGLGALVGQVPALDGPRVVIVDGAVDLDRSDLEGIEGLTITTLRAATEQGSATVAAHRHPDGVADGYAASNLEHGVDGAVVEVADGIALDQAIHVIDIAHPHRPQHASSTGVVVHLGAGSTATVVETRVGDDVGLGGSNVRTTVTLGEGAQLEHIVLQDLPATQVHLSQVLVSQGASSTYRARSFNLGAAYGRLAYQVHLQGPGALADLSGLFFGTGEQTLDQQITVVHGVADTTSRQSFHGVLDDRSTGIFNGGIEVRPGADGTDAAQTNDNLLLSDRAEVNTQPRLEILADEVACVHGATVGQLDETALYYLRSRGIPAEVARRVLINAFADRVVDGVSVEGVRTWLAERLGHDHA